MMEASKRHIEWIDFAKVITMLLVIIGHANYYTVKTSFGGIDYPINDHNIGATLIKTLNNFIYSFHMPLFMALSGAGFSFGIRKFDSLKALARNKARRLLLPFILVSVMVSIPCKFVSGYWDMSVNKLSDMVLGQLLLLGNSHLWFIISLFYIMTVFSIIAPIKERLNNILFWGGLSCLTLIGWYCELHFRSVGSFFGIWGMMKHLLFFSIGFYGFREIETHNYSLKSNLISWIGMVIGWLIITPPVYC